MGDARLVEEIEEVAGDRAVGGVFRAPAIVARRELRVHLLEPGIADALAPHHVLVGEGDRVEPEVRLDVLEPGEALERGGLEGVEHGLPGALIRGERGRDRAALGEGAGERDGILERELGARADREVRGVSRVAGEGHVPMVPPPVADEREVEPPDEAIGEQRPPAEVVLEHPREVVAGLGLGHALETRARPRLGAALDDEGARGRAELVGVGDEEARRRLAEDHDEPVEELLRPEPDIPVAPDVDGGLKEVAPCPAHEAIGAVRAQKQVAVEEIGGVGDSGMKADVHAERLGSALQQIEKGEARDAGEAIAVDGHGLAPVDHVHVVPGLSRARDAGMRLGV